MLHVCEGMMANKSNLFQFFRLMGQLKATKRTGWVERNVVHPESVADHMYRMATLAFLVDPKQGLNKDKCIKLALVHDMAECIVGDIAPSEGVSKEEKHKKEKEAMEHIKSLVPDGVGEELFSLWEDYEFQRCEEAVFVKDLDRFDMIMQAYEYEEMDKKPLFLQDFFNSTKGKFQTEQVKEWVSEIYQRRAENNPEGSKVAGEKHALQKEETESPTDKRPKCTE